MIKVGKLSEEQLDEKAKGGDGKKKKEEEKPTVRSIPSGSNNQ